MEHLNYCRQLAMQCQKLLLTLHPLDKNRTPLNKVIDLHRDSIKFLLPDYGRLLNDMEYRGIDENDTLHLPYQCIAIEYKSPPKAHSGGAVCYRDGKPQYATDDVEAPKRIAFAKELGEFIEITIAFFANGAWRIQPECAIPTRNYIDRTQRWNGSVGVNVALRDERLSFTDYADEVAALMSLLNILQCSNVHIERSEPKNAGKKIKSALPFDTYHILNIDVPRAAGVSNQLGGNHRSPREHLRRGHIRRIADGRRIWVNATVVAAGSGNRIDKDYMVRSPVAEHPLH